MSHPAQKQLAELNARAGGVIREMRKRTGMRQREFAKRAGLSLPVLSNIERGVRPPSMMRLFQLAHAFNFRPSQLLRILEERPNNSNRGPKS